MPFLQCGVADGEGFLSIWQVNQTAANPKPYMVSIIQHSRVRKGHLFMKCLFQTANLIGRSDGKGTVLTSNHSWAPIIALVLDWNDLKNKTAW